MLDKARRAADPGPLPDADASGAMGPEPTRQEAPSGMTIECVLARLDSAKPPRNPGGACGYSKPT